MTSSLFLWVAAAHEVLQPLTPGTRRLPRVAAPALSAFWEQFADQQVPVIITGHSDCFTGMSVANIEATCGRKNVPVTHPTNQAGAWAGIGRDGSVMLSHMLHDPFLAGSNTIGLFDWPLPRHCPELLTQHMRMPKYFAQDWLQRVPPHQQLRYRDSWPSLFVGRNGSFSGAHTDVFGSAFWQYVIEGEKEWHIVDSAEGAGFFGPGARSTSVVHWHDVVGPSELIYIPGNSLHQVRNIGKTISLAGNFVSRGNFESMRAELFKEANPGRYYRQLQESLLAKGFDFSVNASVSDMSWVEFKNQWRAYGPQDSPGGVVISGAGSDEVNGEYARNGQHKGAPQFVMHKGGRVFELFKVNHDDGWWNIQELNIFNGNYEPVHYGALHHSSAGIMPPGLGWAGSSGAGGKKTWRGQQPGPTITLPDAPTETCEQPSTTLPT